MRTSNSIYFFALFILIIWHPSFAQKKNIPKVHSNILYDNNGYYLDLKGNKYYAKPDDTGFIPEMFTNYIKGTPKGLRFDFRSKGLNGVLYYGFIPTDDSKYPHPVYFSKTAKIEAGIAEVNIKDMKGRFDMIGWGKSGLGILGYRVVSTTNNILYDGKINFNAKDFLATDGNYREIAYGKKVYDEVKPFIAEFSIIEGPLVCNLTHESAVIFVKTYCNTVVP